MQWAPSGSWPKASAGWPNLREGGPVKTEADPLDPRPPAELRTTYQAIRYLEETVSGAAGVEGLVLRYGFFYGPGTAFEEGGQFAAMVGKRWFPIVGDGAGVWSFIHVDDAATATLAALERGEPGVYNVVDDPVSVSVSVPSLAEVLGAKPPAGTGVAGAAARRGGRGGDHDQHPRLRQRQGNAGAQLAAPVRQLARGLYLGALNTVGGAVPPKGVVTDGNVSRSRCSRSRCPTRRTSAQLRW
jgi:nucleoside-diphosphate-sugar epimerase